MRTPDPLRVADRRVSRPLHRQNSAGLERACLDAYSPRNVPASACRGSRLPSGLCPSRPALPGPRDDDGPRPSAHQLQIENVVARLALDPEAHVLDVGPGDGTLFRLIGDRVAQCVGVDPSDRAVEKLRALFADAANVRFEVGTCTDLPVPDRLYDIVVINSVIPHAPGRG